MTERVEERFMMRRILDYCCNARNVFLFACTAGIIVSLISLFCTHDIYRDVAHVYAYYAGEAANGGLQAGWVGRVPMLHILLSAGVVKLGMEAYAAAILVSSLFYVLTLFPLRSLLERYLTPVQAAWGCVLYICAPKVIRFSTTGLLDPERTFFLVAALLFFFRLADTKKVRNALLLGGSLALMAVSRGESIVPAVLALAGFPVFAAWKDFSVFRTNVKKICLVSSLAGLVFLAVLSPFCYGNLVYEGAFVPDMRIYELILRPRAAVPAPEAAIPGIHPEIPLWEHVYEILNNTLRGAYELYFAFALIGMFLLIRRKKWNLEHTLLIGLYFLHTAIYLKVSGAYRYSIYLVPVFMPFTVTGMVFAKDRIAGLLKENWKPAAAYLTCAGLAVLFFIQIQNGLDYSFRKKDAPSRQAAEWIRQYAAEHYPDRRVRIASTGGFTAKIVFWSGGESVCNYRDNISLPKDLSLLDFDLLILPVAADVSVFEPGTELEVIPAPEDLPVRIFRQAETE